VGEPTIAESHAWLRKKVFFDEGEGEGKIKKDLRGSEAGTFSEGCCIP